MGVVRVGGNESKEKAEGSGVFLLVYFHIMDRKAPKMNVCCSLELLGEGHERRCPVGFWE